MLQLGFLIVMENRRRNARVGQEKYFLWMLIITFLSFIADIMSSLNKGPDWFFPFAAAGNYIEIMLNTVLLPIFYRYVCEQICDLDRVVARKLNITLWIMAVVCAALVVSTAYTGQIFYFDGAHTYHRGPLFLLPMSILFAMMVMIEGFIISQRQQIEVSYYTSLALFMVPPLIGWALQSLIFGLPFSLLGVTFAALVVFTNIQNRNMDKDYLTGAFNRQTLDNYLQHKIDLSTRQRTFSAILLDIDNFKSINDSFGHYEGDAALIHTVRILRDSVGRTDFIARYGGDEFCVILDSDDPSVVEATVGQIDSRLSDFNRHHKPYPLSFSMGRAIYQPSMGNKAEFFYKIIDQKMYDEKNARRAANQKENY
jgi:diguanylate cyclase (GGDEF)-like protein